MMDTHTEGVVARNAEGSEIGRVCARRKGRGKVPKRENQHICMIRVYVEVGRG
jgi:hypothetical protein